MMECSSTEVQGKEQVNKNIKIGKLFPILFFINVIFFATVKSWKMEQDQFNSTFELYSNKVQIDMHKNLIQYRKFIKCYQVNNSIRLFK